jgi:hypothetical protein
MTDTEALVFVVDDDASLRASLQGVCSECEVMSDRT